MSLLYSFSILQVIIVFSQPIYLMSIVTMKDPLKMLKKRERERMKKTKKKRESSGTKGDETH